MFENKKHHLGIDIGAGGIKLVELRLEKGRPVLFTYGMTRDTHDIHSIIPDRKSSTLAKEPQGVAKESTLDAEKVPKQEISAETQQKIDKYASQISLLCKHSRTATKNAVVSLPVSSVFHAIVTLPALEKPDQLKRMVESEVGKFVPFSLNEMALDYQVLSSEQEIMKNKSQRILVNAVPNELIVFYTSIFQKAGLQLISLEPESSALSRSLVGRDSSVVMLIDIGAQRTNFFIIKDSVPITHQSIDFGGNKIDRIIQNILGVEDQMIFNLKSDLFNYWSNTINSDIEVGERAISIFSPVIEPMIKEIELNLDLYSRQIEESDKKVEKIILTGGTSFLPFFPEYVSKVFKTKCYIGDPWARVVYQQPLKKLLGKNAPGMAVAIGLALRDMV
ncbi:MAG: pilus assembly protein PilM [bacterium]